jgi:hypothetical protein
MEQILLYYFIKGGVLLAVVGLPLHYIIGMMKWGFNDIERSIMK